MRSNGVGAFPRAVAFRELAILGEVETPQATKSNPIHGSLAFGGSVRAACGAGGRFS